MTHTPWRTLRDKLPGLAVAAIVPFRHPVWTVKYLAVVTRTLPQIQEWKVRTKMCDDCPPDSVCDYHSAEFEQHLAARGVRFPDWLR